MDDFDTILEDALSFNRLAPTAILEYELLVVTPGSLRVELYPRRTRNGEFQMRNSAKRASSKILWIPSVLHSCRMLLPKVAIIIGIWLILQANHTGTNMVGVALLVVRVWDL